MAELLRSSEINSRLELAVAAGKEAGRLTLSYFQRDNYAVERKSDASPVTVADERDLLISILAYLKKGGGGEHFVASPGALRAFAERFPKRISLGGTSVRAAIVMGRLGVPATLHLVSINDLFRGLLPASCDYICSSDQDTLAPHLIVQYEQDLCVRGNDIDIRAPFPNRRLLAPDRLAGTARASRITSPQSRQSKRCRSRSAKPDWCVF